MKSPRPEDWPTHLSRTNHVIDNDGREDETLGTMMTIATGKTIRRVQECTCRSYNDQGDQGHHTMQTAWLDAIKMV
jgi:hypothetical protein